jgi:hypothetical protein
MNSKGDQNEIQAPPSVEKAMPEQILTDKAEWADRSKLDQMRRVDIAEYLFVGTNIYIGMRRLYRTYDRLSYTVTLQNKSICKKLLDCFTETGNNDNEYELPQSINNSCIDGYAPVSNQVDLRNPKDIERECKVIVSANK